MESNPINQHWWRKRERNGNEGNDVVTKHEGITRRPEEHARLKKIMQCTFGNNYLGFWNTHLTEPESKGQYSCDAWSQRSNFRYGNRKEISVESQNVSTGMWVPFDRDSILGKSRKESSLTWLNTKHLSLTRQLEGGFLPQIGSSYQNLWVSMSDPLCAPTVVPRTGIYHLGLSFSDRI